MVWCGDLRGAALDGDGRAAPGAPPGPATWATAISWCEADGAAGAAAGGTDGSATKQYKCKLNMKNAKKQQIR